MAGTARTRAVSFLERLRGADGALMTAVRQRPPAPRAAAVKAPRQRRFHLSITANSADVGGNRAAHIYRRTMECDDLRLVGDRMAPHPPTPRLSVWRDLRIPIPRCLPQVVAA